MSLHEIRLITFCLVKERICALSFPDLAWRHNHGRTAPVWLNVNDWIPFRLFSESLGSLKIATGAGAEDEEPVCPGVLFRGNNCCVDL